MKRPRTDPAVADWLMSGGWHIAEAGPQRVERPNFDDADLPAVREAVLARLDLTEQELRRACGGSLVRRISRSHRSLTVALPPSLLAHLGAQLGDALAFDLLPDGRARVCLAPKLDVPAARARIRRAGVSAGLLARLFGLPRRSVYQAIKERRDV